MTHISAAVGAFVRGEEGATAVEYALMIGLIAMVLIVGARFLGNSTGNVLNGAGAAVAAS